MNAKSLLILVLAVFLAACGRNRDVEHQLLDADAVMDCSPDSALRLLTAMCGDRLDDGQRARYALLLTKAMDKNNIPIQNDSLISFSVEYYSGRGDSLEAQSLFYLGFYYAEKRINDKALVLLSQAYETALAAHDIFYASMSAREISIVYRRVFMVDEGLKWARIAKRLFTESGKPIHAAWMDNMIANDLIFCGNLYDAKNLLDSIDGSDLSDNIYFRHNTMINRIELALQLDSNKEVLSVYERLSVDNYTFTVHDRLNQAKAAIAEGLLDDADGYLAMVRNLRMTETDSLYESKLLSKLYAARGDMTRAYETSSIFADDLMSSDARRISNPQTQLLTENYRLKADNHRLQAARNREYIIGLVVVCMLLGALIFIIWMYYRERLVNKVQEVEQLISASRLLEEDLTLSNTRYNELSEENSSLKSSVVGKEAGFEKEIRNLFSRHLDLFNNMCAILHKHKHTKEKNEISHTVLYNKIYKEISIVLHEINRIKVLKELAGIIDKYDNDWVTRFTNSYPDLKEEQYLLAIYLYLGFRPTTIAMLSNYDRVDAVYTAKSRLKKILLNDSNNQDESWIRILFE